MTVEKMTSSAQKTPISLLQELCVQKGITADYKLMSVEGAVHAPTFMYRVQVGETIATATGASKKKAKHAAAMAVLEKLLTEEGGFPKGFVSDGVLVDSDSLQEITSEPAVTTVSAEENVQGNPVGALQERCMKEHWQPPFYETEAENGLPHERVFTIACYVEKFSEKGTGKSKRLAKRQAASQMLERLSCLKISDAKESGEKNKGPSGEKSGRYKDHFKPNVESLYSENVEEFLTELKDSTNSCLLALQNIDLTDENLDCIDLFEKVAAEQEFDINYMPIEQQGKSGNYNCIVQIKSLPVAVCFGSGVTREEAKASCARSALNFIQLMCKK